MLTKIIVKPIPWYVKLFIKQMPEFYEHIPEYKEGEYLGGRGFTVPEFGHISTLYPPKFKKFNNNQSAYYWARFRAWYSDKFAIFMKSYGVYWQVEEIKELTYGSKWSEYHF